MEFVDFLKCVVYIALVAFFPTLLYIKARKRHKIAERELEQGLPETNSVSATVGEKQAGIFYGASVRFPKHKRQYLVTFILKGTRQREFDVPKATFDAIAMGQKGKLTFCGDRFIDFEVEE